MSLVLAPHVEFDADRHEYWYEEKQLSGVTGLIAKKLGLKIPQEFVEEHQEEGIHVHRAVQKWIETGDPESIHPGVKWLMDSFALPGHEILVGVGGEELTAGEALYNDVKIAGVKPAHTYSEVLVSDFKQYASAVDIVREEANGGVKIYDIKKGVFKREYVTWQLSIYKYFIEKYVKKQVEECVCICVKDREYYKIFPKSSGQVEKLLYGQ
jgi:hypothetical protein